MARPSKYTPEILENAEDYLNNHESYGDVVPSDAGLANHLGITRSTLYEWASHNDKQAFSDTLDRIAIRQHSLLVSKGLTSEFNAAITKLMLHNHGYSDRQQTEHSGHLSYSDMSEDDLDAKLRELMANQDDGPES